MVRIGEQRNGKSETRALPSSFRFIPTLAPLFRVALASDLQGIQRGETRSDIPDGQPVIYNSGIPIVDVLICHSLHPQPELSYVFDHSTIRSTRSGYHDRELCRNGLSLVAKHMGLGLAQTSYMGSVRFIAWSRSGANLNSVWRST